MTTNIDVDAIKLAQRLERSAEIVQDAISTYQPKLIVSLVSGGNDSLTAFYVAQRLGIQVDYIVHVYTGTGIQETRQFVELWAHNGVGKQLLLCDAGKAFEDYVERKGFFGKGVSAHAMAYHVLKAGPLRKGIATLRKGRRNFPVLMLTGIRLDESDNRKYNFAAQTVKRDPAAPSNIFVNLIEHWTQQDCTDFLTSVDAPRNPVSKALHRSGECMCGTMQTREDRQLASILYPTWGKQLDALESRVKEQHGWGWGENMPQSLKQERAGQLPLEGFEMCRHCLLHPVASEPSDD